MPQRFLRPGIRTSEAWNKTSFMAQSLYVGILTLVDDFGRYDGRWRLLHAEIFGLRNDVKAQQSAAAFKELCANDLIQHYLSNGKEYLQILRWSERTRTDKSRFPEPPQQSAAERSGTQEKDASLASTSKPVHLSHKPAPAADRPRPPVNIEDWLKDLEKDPTYTGVSVRIEYGKMCAWCNVRGVQPTQRRFINWINRADKPLPAVQAMTKYGMPLPEGCTIRQSDKAVLDYTGRVMDINQVRNALR